MNHRRKPDLGAAAIVAPQAEAARDLARRDAALLAPDAARNLPQPDAMRASPTPDAAPVARAAAHGSVAPDAARTSQAPDAARRSSSSDASAVTHSSSLPDAPTIPEFPSARPRQMKWIPKGMDPSSACRVVVKIPAYVELPCEEYHVTEHLKFVDKDTTNWMDFLADLEAKIKHGKEEKLQELRVSFIDKMSGQNVRIESDSVLLSAFCQCWEIRRLQLEVIVHDLDEHDELDIAVVPCTATVAAPSQVKPRATTMSLAHEEEENEDEEDELELLAPNYAVGTSF